MNTHRDRNQRRLIGFTIIFVALIIAGCVILSGHYDATTTRLAFGIIATSLAVARTLLTK
jgi:hypothetical protein